MKTREKKPDRRAMRSKRLIIEALRELLLEKDYKKISISDIVKRADIGRATFYAHFEDKQALSKFIFSRLLAQIEEGIEASLKESSASDYQTLMPSLALFRVAKPKHQYFKKNAETPVIGLEMLVKPLAARLERKLEEMGIQEAESEIPHRHAAIYLSSSLVEMLKVWILEDMPVPPEEMDRIYQSLAEPTLKQLLGEQIS